MKLKVDTVLIQNDRVSAISLDQRNVVLGVRSGSYFDFNGVGTDIWELLAKPSPVSEILALLRARYAVQTEVMDHDVAVFLQLLLEKQLVRVVTTEALR
jgi:hypothetical protein